MGAYGMDSHNVQRYITPQGYVRNEGNVQVGGFAPYPISYRAIVPRKGGAANLFVPVCLLRFAHRLWLHPHGTRLHDPRQSSAVAAVMAIESGGDAQAVDYAALRKRLLDAGQILESSPSAGAPKLEGIVIDDAQAVKTGAWNREPRCRVLPRRRLYPRWQHPRWQVLRNLHRARPCRRPLARGCALSHKCQSRDKHSSDHRVR